MKLKALAIALAASVMLLGCGTAVAATAENDATPAFSMEFVDMERHNQTERCAYLRVGCRPMGLENPI